MTNQNGTQGVQVFTGEGIQYFQLATLKQALKLESKGMKTRGGALRPAWAAKLGLKPRDSYETFINKIQEKMEAMLVKGPTPENPAVLVRGDAESTQK